MPIYRRFWVKTLYRFGCAKSLRLCAVNAISELYRGYLEHWISLRPTGYRTARSRRQDLSLLNAQFQVCRDMRFRSSHGGEMKIKDDR